jgi:ferredoxin-NADP reductase
MQEAEFKLLVKRMTWEAQGVLSLSLLPADGGTLPAWEPGAHIDVELGGGLVRQYSLCSEVGNLHEYRIAVLREAAGRGGSEFVHTGLRPGQTLTGRGPRNHFKLAPAAKYMFIAGGIGITPLVPMLATVERAGLPWRLLYGGRTRAAMAFTDELAAYGSKVEFCPQDERGLLNLDGWLSAPDPDARIYCCGPESLLAAVESRCQKWPEGSLHVERFAPKAAEPRVGAERSFEVVCKASGLTVQVGPDRTILQALEAAGLDMPHSCEEGICGTCETRVLEGIPDHRDSILTERERRENATMMICISRALSDRLVLDC